MRCSTGRAAPLRLGVHFDVLSHRRPDHRPVPGAIPPRDGLQPRSGLEPDDHQCIIDTIHAVDHDGCGALSGTGCSDLPDLDLLDLP